MGKFLDALLGVSDEVNTSKIPAISNDNDADDESYVILNYDKRYYCKNHEESKLVPVKTMSGEYVEYPLEIHVENVDEHRVMPHSLSDYTISINTLINNIGLFTLDRPMLVKKYSEFIDMDGPYTSESRYVEHILDKVPFDAINHTGVISKKELYLLIRNDCTFNTFRYLSIIECLIKFGYLSVNDNSSYTINFKVKYPEFE